MLQQEHSGQNYMVKSTSISVTFPPKARKLISALSNKSAATYFVGGVVRDSLLGIDTDDIDVAVGGDARKIAVNAARVLKAVLIDLDSNRGIYRIILPGKESFQADFTTASEGIIADLANRDFTINSIAINTNSLFESSNGLAFNIDDLIDPHHGAIDIEEGILRVVSETSFLDDPARLIRAVRFMGQLGLAATDETVKSLRNQCKLIQNVAPERVRDEFLKILSLPDSVEMLKFMDKIGLLGKIIPEIEETKKVGQPKEHYWDVFNHLIECVGQLERLFKLSGQESQDIGKYTIEAFQSFPKFDEHFSQDAGDGHSRLTICKLACLLHDISKPQTKSIDAKGRTRFLGHQEQGAKISSKILTRLRMSRRVVSLVTTQVLHHLRPSQMAPEGKLPSQKAIYRYYRDVGDASIDTLFLYLADYMSARGPRLKESEWIQHCSVVTHILNQGFQGETSKFMSRLIDGHDIMDWLSLPPGPQIGHLLSQVEEAQAEGIVKTKEEALRFVSKRSKPGE